MLVLGTKVNTKKKKTMEELRKIRKVCIMSVSRNLVFYL